MKKLKKSKKPAPRDPLRDPERVSGVAIFDDPLTGRNPTRRSKTTPLPDDFQFNKSTPHFKTNEFEQAKVFDPRKPIWPPFWSQPFMGRKKQAKYDPENPQKKGVFTPETHD